MLSDVGPQRTEVVARGTRRKVQPGRPQDQTHLVPFKTVDRFADILRTGEVEESDTGSLAGSLKLLTAR